MQIQRIEFEPPVPTNSPLQFTGFVCVAWTESGVAVSGCDCDPPEDAYTNASAVAQQLNYGCILLHTVQMFRIGSV